MWPQDDSRELEAFYGSFELGANGLPTTAWREKHLITLVAPYPLTLAWDASLIAKRVTCHRKVAPSLKRILAAILGHYGNLEGVRRARMHLYGGCFEFRRISGSHRLSTHAYGAGIDLDPQRNPLGKKYEPGSEMMPEAVVRIFQDEGWKWGGTFVNRPDCMHFQATS